MCTKYGGTKTEMERLLSDAQKLTGVEYNIDNLSDVYNAIHAIQQNLGITGTTAKEAEQTFSGSFQQMKAAASNLWGYMANAGKEDMSGFEVDQAMEALIDSISTFLFGNALPMIGRFAGQIPKLIGDFIRKGVPMIIEEGKNLITNFGKGMSEQFPQLAGIFDNLIPILQAVGAAFAALKLKSVLPSITSGLTGVKTALMAINAPALAISAAIAAVVGAFVWLWNTNEGFRQSLIDTWNKLKEKVEEFTSALTEKFSSMGITMETVTETISELWNGFCNLLAPVFEVGWSLVVDILSSVLDIIMGMGITMETVTETISELWNGFCNLLAPVFEVGWSLVVDILSSVLDIIMGLVDTFIALFSGDWEGFWSGIGEIASAVWNGICQIIDGAVQFLSGLVSSFLSGVSTLWSTVWEGIKSFASGIWEGIKTKASEIFNGLKTDLAGIWDGIKTKVHNIWNGLVRWLSSKWHEIVNNAASILEGVKEAIVAPFEWAKSKVEGIWNFITGKSRINVSVKTNMGGAGHTGVMAMASGGVFKRATLFPHANTLIGEAGPEAVIPLAEFYDHLDSSLNSGYQDQKLDQMIGLLEQITKKDTNVYLDKRTLVGGTVSEYERRLSERKSMKLKLEGAI